MSLPRRNPTGRVSIACWIACALHVRRIEVAPDRVNLAHAADQGESRSVHSVDVDGATNALGSRSDRVDAIGRDFDSYPDVESATRSSRRSILS